MEQPQNQGMFQQQEQTVLKFEFLRTFLQSTAFQVLVNLLTVFALFGDDVRVAGFRVSADIVFDGINIVCIVIVIQNQIVFSTEIILSVICVDGYFLSFFFFLDVVSTISLLLDIGMFLVAVGLQSNSATNTSSLARAGRASRVGTKAGRVVRLVRLIRLVKLYKAATNGKEDEAKVPLRKRKFNAVEPTNQTQKGEGDTLIDDEEVDAQESKVSKKLSELTTKKVIIVVLVLLFLIPLFDTGYYTNPPPSMQIQVEMFVELAQSNLSTFTDVNRTYNQIIADHLGIYTPIVYLSSPFSFVNSTSNPPGQTWSFPTFQDSDLDNLRTVEQDAGSTQFNFTILFANTNDIPQWIENQLYFYLFIK